MALFREFTKLLTTDWTLLKTIPAGNGANVDIEFSNNSGLTRNVSIAMHPSVVDPASINDASLVRGPIALYPGSDFNPHHLAIPGGWSVFAKSDGGTVRCAISGTDGA